MLCNVILPFFWLTFCQVDETLSGYAPRQVPYRLEELNGAPVSEAVTLVIPGRKQIQLRTACFAYRGRQTLPYPWFAFDLVQTTEYSCIEQPIEDSLRAAILSASLVEAQGDLLILSNGAGLEMVFRAAQP